MKAIGSISVKKELEDLQEVTTYKQNGLTLVLMDDRKNSVEIFYYKFKPVSKKKYLELRQKVAPDMPLPSDLGQEPNFLLEWKKSSQRHHKDSERAKRSDSASLSEIVKYMPILEASDLIDNYNLGTTAGQKAFIWLNSLFKYGASALYLDAKKFGVNVDCDRLICELPELPSQRKRIFEFAAKRSIDGGFDPVMDDGQRYLLIGFE